MRKRFKFNKNNGNGDIDCCDLDASITMNTNSYCEGVNIDGDTSSVNGGKFKK